MLLCKNQINGYSIYMYIYFFGGGGDGGDGINSFFNFFDFQNSIKMIPTYTYYNFTECLNGTYGLQCLQRCGHCSNIYIIL